MRFLDICHNPHNQPDGDTPYLLVVQGDYVDVRTSRVVIPLVDASSLVPVKGGLMPEFQIEGRDLVLATPQIAGIHVRDIGTVVASAAERMYEIRRAIDILTGSF